MLSVVAGCYSLVLPVSDLDKVHNDLSTQLNSFVSNKIRDIDIEISKYNDFNEYDLAQIEELRVKKNEVLNLPRFHEETRVVIEKYHSMRGSLVFGQQDNLQPIIDAYIDIAKKYFTLSVHSRHRHSDKCVTCGIPLTTNGCSNCGTITNIVHTKVLMNLAQPVNNTENLENFIEALKKLQGLGTKQIPDYVYTSVCTALYNSGKPYTRGVLETNQYTDDMLVQTKDTSLKIMQSTLSSLRLSDYYGDMYILARDIWGWKLPNLYHVEDWFIWVYKEIYKYYHLVKGDRSSCINVQSLLYELMKKAREFGLIRWDCKKIHFKMVTDTDIQSEYSRMVNQMFRLAGITAVQSSQYRVM